MPQQLLVSFMLTWQIIIAFDKGIVTINFL